MIYWFPYSNQPSFMSKKLPIKKKKKKNENSCPHLQKVHKTAPNYGFSKAVLENFAQVLSKNDYYFPFLLSSTTEHEAWYSCYFGVLNESPKSLSRG